MRLEIAGAESRVESRAPLFVFISVESEKVPRSRHCPCEVFALFMANWKTIRRDSLTHRRVVDDCDRLAAKGPEIQVDDGRATGRPGEVVAPVHHNVPSRICARGILGIEIAYAFQKHEVAEDERVVGSDHLS